MKNIKYHQFWKNIILWLWKYEKRDCYAKRCYRYKIIISARIL